MSKKRRLTDRQCRLFLSDMHEFGYPSLTFEEVRKIANDYADGKEMTCVIGMILENQLRPFEARK